MSSVFRFLPIVLLLLTACGPSQEEIDSGRNLDQAVRQLNSVCKDFSQGISDEGQLSRIEMGDYYGKYVNRIQKINQDLAGKTLVGDYRNHRAVFDSVSTQASSSIRLRKRYISDLLDLSDLAEDFRENVSRAEESDYNTRQYLAEAYLKERKFNRKEDDVDSLRSDFENESAVLDTLIEKYNSGVGRGDLVTRDSIRHCTAIDSLPDFARQARVMLKVVQFDYGTYDDIIERVKRNREN